MGHEEGIMQKTMTKDKIVTKRAQYDVRKHGSEEMYKATAGKISKDSARIHTLL